MQGVKISLLVAVAALLAVAVTGNDDAKTCLETGTCLNTEDASGKAQAAVAANYYDSDDAFNFYQHTWGGESIHAGLYDVVPSMGDGTKEKFARIKQAAALATERLFTLPKELTITKDTKVADFGAGYGGTGRHAARTYGCSVLCVEVSKKENEYNRQKNKEAGLDHLVNVPDNADFFSSGADDASMDLVVSQEALLHAGVQREKAIAEISRILKPGGYLVFTDFMMKKDADRAKLDKVFKRIKLEDMASNEVFEELANKHGLTLEQREQRSSCGLSHFTLVHEVLEEKKPMIKDISPEFIDNMLGGLAAWRDSYQEGLLTWGFTVFRKQ